MERHCMCQSPCPSWCTVIPDLPMVYLRLYKDQLSWTELPKLDCNKLMFLLDWYLGIKCVLVLNHHSVAFSIQGRRLH